jgi:vitamin B12 transporter
MRQILLAAGILGGAMPALLAQTSSPAPPSTPAAALAAPPGPSGAGGASFAEAVVVTASIEPTPLDATPAAATVYDSRDIEARQARSLDELLWSVPGVTVMQAGAPGQQTSVFTRGANSNQTLLLWNGIPLNDPYFGDINWQFVPTEGAARVEVVRGPFSALYGSNAVGGVVQVITGSRQGLTAAIEGGERGYVRGQLAAGANLGPVHVDLIGHARRSEDTLVNDFFDSEEGVARALWTAAPGASLGLLVRADDSKTGVPFTAGVPTPDTTISWQEREAAIPFDLTGGRWLLNAQLSETHFNSTFRSPDDPFGAYASNTRSDDLHGRAVGSYHLLQQPGQDLEVALGTDGEGFRVSNSDVFGVNLNHAHQRTWAGFGEARYGTGPIRLDVGLRHDDNDVYGGQTSLRAGAVVSLAAHTRLRGSFGQAFRAPSLGELFFPFSGNPALRPETSTSYEAGLEQDLGHWRITVTGFENRERNLIVFDNATSMDINIGRARSRGLEGVLNYRQGILDAELNATRLEATDQTTGHDLVRRPKASANALLTLRPGSWTFNLAGRYVGPRADFDPATGAPARNPGFVRLDLAASWRALHWLAPYARVENLADRRYAEVLGYPSPRRTLIGGVALDL